MVKNKCIKILIIALILLTILGIFIYKKFILNKDSNKEKIEILNNSSIESSVYSNRIVKKVLDFKSETCLPCKQMEVLLNELKQEYYGKVDIISIDVNEYQEISTKYKILYTPTIVFLDENDNEISRTVGFIGKSKLKRAIENGGKVDGNT